MSQDLPSRADPGRGVAQPLYCNGKPDASGPPLFMRPGLIDRLESFGDAELDDLPFGLIGMTPNGCVVVYNAVEARLSGLSASRVIGRHLFTEVAPCMNNYMISHRFETEAELDETRDYVFTLRMAPTRVRVRLLKRAGARRMYVAVERR